MKTRLYIASSAFVLSYGAVAFTARMGWGATVGIIATIAAVLSFAWFIVEEVAALRCLDELQRRIQLEAVALGFSGFVLLLIGLGSLQRFIVLPLDAWNYRSIWPFAALFYFIGVLIAKARYR